MTSFESIPPIASQVGPVMMSSQALLEITLCKYLGIAFTLVAISLDAKVAVR